VEGHVLINRENLIGGLLLLVCGSASAADLPVPPEAVEIVQPSIEPQWSFAIAPYLWAAGINGDVAQFGLPAVEIDSSFSDILDHLDFAAMLVSEIRYGRYGLFSDFMYVKISGSAGTPRGILADSVSLDTQTLAFTAAPEYRIVESPRGSLDLMAGMRVWWVDTELSFSGGILDDVNESDGDTWVDPLVGAKGRFDLGSRFYLTGWAMVGGFGVSSDFMWDAWGGVGYEFNDTFSTVLGYRGTGVDYENDGFEYDVIQHGPVLGGVFRF
jgi:hypothetical protein